MFLKEKWTDSIKGCACEYGWLQRKTAKKGAASDTTVQTELVLITVWIDVMENCDVAIADISRAFLMSHIDKEFHMLLGGEMAEVMRHIFPDHYAKYV